MLIGCMIVVKCDTCKIFDAYAHLDCTTSTVGDIGNRHSMQLRVTGLCEGNSPATGEFPAVTSEFPAQKPVTRNMLPFDDVIMKTGNIDVGDEYSPMK